MPASVTWRCVVPDYSEFPTTPTAWQEQQLRDWQVITPLTTEDPPRPERRGVDLTALVPGLFFVVPAGVLMARAGPAPGPGTPQGLTARDRRAGGAIRPRGRPPCQSPPTNGSARRHSASVAAASYSA